MSHAFTIATTIEVPFPEAVDATRVALADQGFGIISEIDLAATLKQKLGVDMPPQLILGACRPELAHQAVVANPSIAAALPCNVVVRELGAHTCMVEAFDPDEMARMSDDDTLRAVATDARARLVSALDRLGVETREA